MRLITITSDFGITDSYVSSIKAVILSKNPSQQIVDISHNIRLYDISHAAHVMKRVFRDFPKGTIHIVAVAPLKTMKLPSYVAVQLEEHIFIGEDSGIFSLISDKLPIEQITLPYVESTFPAKEIFAPIALKLALDEPFSSIGSHHESLVHYNDLRPSLKPNAIHGQVVAIDHYGNLITNLVKSDFDLLVKKLGGNVTYELTFWTERITRLHKGYSDVLFGNCYAFFNSQNEIQIGINGGNASKLMGLRVETPVTLTFYKEDEKR